MPSCGDERIGIWASDTPIGDGCRGWLSFNGAGYLISTEHEDRMKAVFPWLFDLIKG